ncbi:hypothetical protein M116_2141 [Bacteroides fragilis str. 3719 A10]|uniref:Uncharacterized protein n=1 Tax=Bacteroides fragilis str. 3988T(B)14 TaxID=1339315 RepID=A0A015W1R5_BACFG|nr:hypothetical protein M085_5208 [Bacteroides fragilis str. 3986 N(B)19]EXY74415.1 hypothetical protein M124_1702 [Bacteroides fragilis str. 3988T(B)14]EXZ58258.1 hypothetical protein M116_2141 [Bacteroides fragilis str. 3719 A10]EYA71406.1 hypothetical protein M132_1853 [Bacteroides fragilis str. S24L15]EYA75838.1 hypothetical protein M133_1925 [Bacteroides fragilis str. S24L26]
MKSLLSGFELDFFIFFLDRADLGDTTGYTDSHRQAVSLTILIY